MLNSDSECVAKESADKKSTFHDHHVRPMQGFTEWVFFSFMSSKHVFGAFLKLL